MARLIGFAAILVGIGLLVALVLAVLQLMPGIIFFTLFLPLFAFIAGFFVALVLAASNQLTSDNVRALILYGSGAASGIAVARIVDWWNAINHYIKNPTHDPLDFIAAACAFFLLAGATCGLVVGLRLRAPVQTLITQGTARLAALLAAYRSLLLSS